MRAVWAFVVVCLMAVGGVAPARGTTARDDLTGEQARDLRDGHPALPAITAARGGSIGIATRPRPLPPQLPPAVLATPPALRAQLRDALAAPARLTALDPSIAPALRSARGPPV